MRIYAASLALVLVGSMPANATEYGIGVSATSNVSSMYFPISVSDSLRIEPFIRHLKQDDDEGGIENTFNLINLGVGIFNVRAIDDKYRCYFGARTSYLYVEREYRNDTSSEKVKDNGFSFTPVIGFEYLVSTRFSVGAEAEWYYQRTSGDVNFNGSEENRSSTEYGTNTRILLRFLF